MTTATKQRKPRRAVEVEWLHRPDPHAGAVRLGDSVYLVVAVLLYDYRTEREALAGWRFHKIIGPRRGGPPVDVDVASFNRPSCSCADWIYRRDRSGESCKHVEAIRGLQ